MTARRHQNLHFSREIRPPPSPLRQMMTRKAKNLHIPREIRSPPPTVLVGGGWYCEIMLDVRAFLAFRQWPSLAEGPVRAVATKYYYLILNHALIALRINMN